MLIKVILVARDAADATTSVSATIDLDTGGQSWPRDLVETVTGHAHEGARRLRDQLLGAECATGNPDAGTRADASSPAGPAPFTPLADVVPAASAGTAHRA